MRKLTKRMIMLLVTVLLLAASSVAVSAAGTISYPKKTHTYPGGTGYVQIDLSKDFSYRIQNVKSNSKYLIARQTGQTAFKNAWESRNTADITYYAKKAGTYKITFEIVNAKKKKVGKERTIKVYVNNDFPIKNVTINGKNFTYGLFNKKSARFKVTMNNGYKLDRIEVVTQKRVKNAYGGYGTEDVVKKINNGGKFKLGTTGYYYFSETNSINDEEWNKSYSKDMFANTDIKVYYKDKYTKEIDSIWYSLYKWAK